MTKQDKTQVSLRLPSSLVSEFDRIGEVLDRDRTWVIQKALAAYLATEGAEILADAAGLEELDRGESVEVDDVLDNARKLVAAAEYRNGLRAG